MASFAPQPSLLSSAPTFLLEIFDPPRNYTWTGFALLVAVVFYVTTRSKSPYDDIPAIGRTGTLTSYLSAWDYIKNAPAMLQQGYDQYKSTVFRVPEINRWHMLTSDEKHIEEVRKAPDDILSQHEAIRELFALDYTLGPNISPNSYHIGIIRTRLTRNIGDIFADMQEELVLAVNESIPAKNQWVKVKALDTMMAIVTRTSNRVLVGAPKCRDPEYIALNKQFTIDVITGSEIIELFPTFLKPLAGRMFTNVPKSIETGLKHLRPLIEERLQKIEEYGNDYPNKPNDMLSWLMDEAKGEERSVRNLTLRILVVNFLAIHTTSMTFTHALYTMVEHPQYIAEIRAEVEGVIAHEGWSKNALTRMHKLDSFLKESQRLHPLRGISVTRKVLQPFTFSDGTRIPKGSIVSAVTNVRHRDESIYPDANEFKPFRFCSTGVVEGQGMNNLFVTASKDYLSFGLGRDACPGRFFASNELKAMMGYILLTYDVKLESDGVRPPDEWFGVGCVPNRQGEVLFRKRQN